MADFINESHGVELSGPDGLLRMLLQIALSIHLLGQKANGVVVREDDIAAAGEEGFVNLMPLAD